MVLILLLISLNCRAQSTENSHDFDLVKTGDRCPDFSIYSPDQEKLIHSSELTGKVTLINFFATWCGPCMKELPEVQNKIWEKYGNNPAFNLLVIGRGHNEKEIESFKNKHQYGFNLFADSSKAVYERFALKYIPRNYIIDKNGIIVFSGVNYTELEFAEMLKKIEELLK